MRDTRAILRALPLGVCLLAASGALNAGQQAEPSKPLQNPANVERTFAPVAAYVPDLTTLVAATSELRDTVDRFAADRQALMRFHTVQGSQERRSKLRAFYDGWLKALPKVDFARLSKDGQVDYVLLRNYVDYQLMLLGREDRSEKEAAPLLLDLRRNRRQRGDRFVRRDEVELLAILLELDDRVRERQQRASLEANLSSDGQGGSKVAPFTAARASQQVERLRGALDQWFAFYNGYDPGFTAKVPEIHRGVSQALTEYSRFLREKIAGTRDASDIVGNPIGRDGLLEDLAGEMIPYTPEELIEIGNREYAWIEAEMKKASREMGMGEDWHAALDKVKGMYVPQGEQPALIRNLALEAEAYLRKHDLVTIPALASDMWKMTMMSPERQRVNPFFTGGETISVSYPHVSMAGTDQAMSLRGNGIHVSRATVQHELIPGHHLKGFMSDRYNVHRNLFSTPFMGEGWALYWELLLWDDGFPRSPEDRVGMLWWRMHRAARIIFSLNFHLARWTPDQCIDFLVNRVGHERFTATGEVRRSFAGNYSPLYQVAYMMGGLQIRSLYKELVETKKMTRKQFHDAILKANSMPIEMLRALMTSQPLTREYRAQWKYYGDVPAARQ